MSKNTDKSERGLREPVIADVLAQTITAVQSQEAPAEEAMKAAMETIDASQKAALNLLIYSAQAQAEVVQELLANDGAKARSLVSEMGDLLLGAVERSPEVIGSFAAGLAGFLNSVAAPVKPSPEPQPAAVPDPLMEHPAPEPQPLTEAQLLEAIIQIIADGYSTAPGGAVANTIRECYPAVIPVMQRYLAMDDFLVLMWLRQQPALAEFATDQRFPQYYAELKAGIQ